MGIINSILTWVMKKRIHDIELFMKYPLEVQDELFTNLMEKGRFSEFGEKYEFNVEKILPKDFQLKDLTTLESYRMSQILQFGKGKDFEIQEL